MGNPTTPVSFSKFFTESQFETQEERLAVGERSRSVTIGIPKENHELENRVSIVPNSIRTLVGFGHKVLVESNAGDHSNFSDNDFSEAGAKISYSKEEVFKSDIVVKIAPATLEEIGMMHDDKIIISPIQIPTLNQEYFLKLKEKRITALAMEYLQSEDDSFPIVRIMSEMAGIVAIHTAAEYLTNTDGGRGVLLQ